MWIITASVIVSSVIHLLLGLISVCVGVASSIQAEVWLAHRISPMWSGALFIITGIMGFACAKKKTAYMIMCFTAFSIVSLVTAVVSIQLLRLGLVNHTTDGQTFQKEHKDVLILIALGAAGCECLICVISSIISCRLAKAAKKELQKRREETFHVQDDDEADTAGASGVHDQSAADAQPYVVPLHYSDNLTNLTFDDGQLEQSSNDFLKSWDLSNIQYLSLEDFSTSNQPDNANRQFSETSIQLHVNPLPDSDTNMEIEDGDKRTDNERESTESTTTTTVSTTTTAVTHGIDNNTEHLTLPVIDDGEINNIDSSEERISDAEKPRLKRILRLIADERTIPSLNTNNNAHKM